MRVRSLNNAEIIPVGFITRYMRVETIFAETLLLVPV